MPKVRNKLDKKKILKKTHRLLKKLQSANRNIRYFALIVIILSLSGLTLAKNLLTEKEAPEQVPQESPKVEGSNLEATLEGQLNDFYQKDKKIEINQNFKPRYSVFENGIVGYRFFYPVGFTVTPIGNHAQVVSNTNQENKILVTVQGDSFEVSIQAFPSENLQSAADFIRNSFSFIPPISYNPQNPRFQGAENTEKKY